MPRLSTAICSLSVVLAIPTKTYALPAEGLTALSQRPAEPPLLAFHQQDGRVVATLQRSLLERDFLVKAEVVAATAAISEAPAQQMGPAPLAGTQSVSGALRLRRLGDSVVLSEYTGTVDGQLQYRQRATLPVLRTMPDGVITIEAMPLWTALRPRATSGHAVDIQIVSPKAPPSPITRSTISQWPNATTVMLPVQGRTVTYQVGILLLPKVPMRGRISDPRVGFFSVTCCGAAPDTVRPDAGQVPGTAYIWRQRLEKQNPEAAVSDVVQPVIFRIMESVPERWIPHVKKGVEDWIPVFEAMGFRNAIVVRLPGEPNPDTTQWEIPIEWGKTSMQGVAKSEQDPRSGEMLRTQIDFSDGIIDQSETLYFNWSGGVHDPGARRVPPFPDSVTGRLLERAVRHEVGHAFGLDHNFNGTAYPTDSLRRPSFLRRMGSMPTTMGYSWINYVAQAEDSIAAEDLIAQIGPYDRWAIAWGYRPIPEATTSEAELPTLERWRTAQDTAPYLRTSLARNLIGETAKSPYEQANVLGDDMLKSISYGIRRMAYFLDILQDEGEATSKIRHQLGSGWLQMLDLLFPLIGGEAPHAPYPRDTAKIEWRPIDPDYQTKALRFLLAHLVYGQDDMVRRMVTNPPQDSTGLVLFESLTPEWKKSETMHWNTPLQVHQQRRLLKLLNRNRLARFASYVSPEDPRLPSVVCRDLAMLRQRIAATAADPSAPERQRPAQGLEAIVTPITTPSTGLCS